MHTQQDVDSTTGAENGSRRQNAEKAGQERSASRVFPWAFVVALAVTAIAAAGIGCLREQIGDPMLLMYAQKLGWADHGPDAEIIVLGDSQAISAIRPVDIEAQLPAGTTLYNYALAGAGPTGGEIVLARYLAAHASPRLVVLAYTDVAFEDHPEQFAGMVIPNLLGFRDVVRLAARTTRPGYLLDWLKLQIPTLRYRLDLGTLALGKVLRAFPPLESLLLGNRGEGSVAFTERLHRFHMGDHARRNREYLADVERERGWKYLQELAFPGQRLPAGFRDFLPPSDIEIREEIALAAILSMCEKRSVPVLVLPLPKPRAWLAEASGVDREREFRQFWLDAVSHTRGVMLPSRSLIAFDHRYFSDRSHLNPKGAREFATLAGPLIAAAYEARP